jgi:hypothetical protein
MSLSIARWWAIFERETSGEALNADAKLESDKYDFKYGSTEILNACENTGASQDTTILHHFAILKFIVSSKLESRYL